MKKKFLAVLLTLLMLLGALAMTTAADGGNVAEVNGTQHATLQAAVDAAGTGETVTLLADTSEDVTINKSITLNLGGNTLTNTGAGKATLTVASGAVATVKNGSVVGGKSYYTIQNNGTLTLETVTATAGNTGSSMIDNWGTMTITSGTYSGGLNVVKSEEGSTLNISGGKFTLSYATDGYTGVIFAYGTTTISGGEFIQALTTTGRWAHPQVILTGVVDGYTAITKVTGGNFVNKSEESIFRGVGKATSDNFEVSGGTFNKYVSDSYFKTGYIPVKNADGTYGVKEGKFVAEVGSTGYETFDEAIAAANASTKSKTIYLRENVTVDHQIVIKNTHGKNITLNLEGFTLTSTYAINTSIKNGSYALVNNTPLTIKNGTFAAGQARAIGALAALTLNGATVTQTLTGGHACVAFCADGATYTVNNKSVINGAYSLCIFANNATVTVSNSTLNGTGNTLYHNGSNYGLKLTVTNTTITSSGGCGVYISGSTSAQENAANQNGAGGYQKAGFTGCTISGAENGVEVKYTDLTLDGCKVKSTSSAAPSYSQNNNGSAASGFAVVSTDNAMNNTTPKPEGTITITGSGKYTGPVGLGSLESVKTEFKDFTDDTIKISGGTFDREVPEEYCADGYIPTKNADGTYGVKEGSYVAKIGDTKYDSLAKAVTAARDGDTVTLLASCNNSVSIEVQTNIIIDLNGKTVTNSADKMFTTRGEVTIRNGEIKGAVASSIVNAYNKLTLTNVTITGATGSDGKNLVNVCSGAEVTIDKNTVLTATGGEGVAVFVGQNGAGAGTKFTLNIYGKVTQNAKSFAIAGNGSYTGYTCINIYEGAEVKSSSCVIYQPQAGEINVYGGLVEGYCAIGVKSGSLNISGGTIRGTANDNVLGDEHSTNGGMNYDGSAIVVDSRSKGYAGDVKIHVTGGAVESYYSTAIREIGDDPSATQLTELTVSSGSVFGASKEPGKVESDILVHDVTAENVSVSGGTFSHKVQEDYCANGYIPTTNADGTYTVMQDAPTTYAVAVADTEHGAVTVRPRYAERGRTVTVTVTPDDGYVLETLTVTDKNGNAVELTDKGSGKYTFKMPGRRVEIKATFMEDNSVLNFFVDVPNDAYYYEAVKWAVENGITQGRTETTFCPEDTCTRAEIVTFLWRAFGSPEVTSAVSYTDVDTDAYYAAAVAWAVENGITVGTSDTTFSPDDTCTRAQAVTFLCRAAGLPEAASALRFTDVAESDYFAGPVKWAVENGVTVGTSDTTFSPEDTCTRAQIVTFLFRLYAEK